MKQKMHALWDEVRTAEEAIGEGVHGALERFILAAGTMVENFRLARSNFDKNRVRVFGAVSGPWLTYRASSEF
jgi:general transcription factor 3C polypeptide 3 (transcription factor C subunit 4)